MAQIQHADDQIIRLLENREGKCTHIKLTDQRKLIVWNIAWGYDTGDPFAHITTNIGIETTGITVDHFSSSQILRISDGITGEILYRNARC